MSKLKVAIIGGARPNFMKIFPLVQEFKKNKIFYFLVNTGQHFDKKMAQDFFVEFGIHPDYNLRPSHFSVIKQFSDIMIDLEKIFLKEKPNLVIVVGDVNSTLAGALVANKLGIKLAHVEAGLRSYNKEMPEEYNRILTDHLADFLFVSEESGIKNLHREGINKNIFFVGNIMLDTLRYFSSKIKNTKDFFYYCTLHRGENVDDKGTFKEILAALKEIARDSKIYLPLHPRTKKMAEQFGLMSRLKKIFELLPPLSYKESLFYEKNAQLILTDSGGVQEEATFLGVPCLTLRTETERPVTTKLGTNTVAGISKRLILRVYRCKDLKRKEVQIKFWDGLVCRRIVKIIKKYA